MSYLHSITPLFAVFGRLRSVALGFTADCLKRTFLRHFRAKTGVLSVPSLISPSTALFSAYPSHLGAFTARLELSRLVWSFYDSFEAFSAHLWLLWEFPCRSPRTPHYNAIFAAHRAFRGAACAFSVRSDESSRPQRVFSVIEQDPLRQRDAAPDRKPNRLCRTRILIHPR